MNDSLDYGASRMGMGGMMDILDPNSSANPGLTDVFALLDRWRHFPAYKLEPRADPFFALFLPAILEDYSGRAIHPEVIPEFPLRRGTLFGEDVRGPNRSKRVDYAICTQDRATLFLVEVKTDMASRSPTQDQYLQKAKEVGLSALVRGICRIQQQTNKPEKYKHLAEALSELRLLDETKMEIVYIQPTATSSTEHSIIDFDRVARVVKNRGELGVTFADYLCRWTKQRAGEAAT